MGCTGSKQSFPPERLFPVTILDEKEEPQAKGTMTVTTDAMMLQQHGHSDKAVWELRYLRRFGYDKKYFSFEAGRRCTDGPGIWAVSTPKAKELFSMVDFYVNKVKQTPIPDQTHTTAAAAPAENPYKGVGTAGSGEPKKLAYAQLDLSSKAAFKIAKGNGAGKGKATTSYAELDFEQMDAMADGNQGVAL